MALENRAEEAKPYDVVIDAFTDWHASYVESAQKFLEFAKSSESKLKNITTFLRTFACISTRTQSDVKKEIMDAVVSPQRLISPELLNIAELLVKLTKENKIETLLLAIQTDFDKYTELQNRVRELRTANRQQEVNDTSEYLSLHKLVIGDNLQFPEIELIKKATLCLGIIFHLSTSNATLLDDDERHTHSPLSTETDSVNNELTLNEIKKILEDFFEHDMKQAEQLARLWPSEVQEAAFGETMEIVSHLKHSLERWTLLRQETVNCLREMSKDLHNHNKNVAISQTVASGTGIFASVLGIIGLGLAPVTFGASLGLAIAAAVLGGASALTYTGSTIARHVIGKDRVRMLEELIKKEKEELGGTEDDTTEERMRDRALNERLFKLHLWVQSNQLRHETDRSTNNTDDNGILALRITLPVVYFLTGASSGVLRILAPLEAGAAIAGAAARVAPRVVLGLGGVLSVVTLPLDIVSIVFLANELKGGAKSTLGEEFDRMADRFEVELRSIQRLLEHED